MPGRAAKPTAHQSTAALALAALDALPETSAIVFDGELRCSVFRGPALAHDGFSSQDVEGKLMANAFGPERWAVFEPLCRAALRGETCSAEIALPDSKCWYLVKAGPLRAGDHSGEIIGGVAFTIDITGGKHPEEQYRSLLEFTPDAVAVVDGDGQILLINDRAESLFGYTRDELVGQSIELLVPGRFRTAHASHRDDFRHHAHARPTGADVGVELLGQRKDGSEFPAEISLGPLKTEHGLLISAVVHDITARKRAEHDAAHLAAIVDSSGDAIISKDFNGNVISWNHGAELLYGYSEAEMLGQPISLLVPPGRDDEPLEILRRMRLGERIDEYETVRTRKDGTQVNVSLTVSRIRGPDGAAIGVSTITHDITDRLHHQEQLRVLAEQDSLTGVFNRRRF